MTARNVTIAATTVLALSTSACPGTASADDALARRYGSIATKIMASVAKKNNAYERLEELCVDIGHRLSGSKALDRAIAWAKRVMKADGHENVAGEKVMIPKWVRGKERLTLVAPREMELRILGLGGSVGTGKGGLTAEVLAVTNEKELKALGAKARGRIILFNNKMPDYDPQRGAGYGETVTFRVHGARLAAAQGAVGVLVRSVTAHSLSTPHTGGMHYGDARTKIPAAAITVEGAELIARLVRRGRTVKVRLEMGAKDHGLVPSANVVAELRGSTQPDEIVVISGHLDAWDVGQGAHDDGAGCVIAMEALSVLRRLGLRPRRTIRVVLWTNEENGLRGAKQYAIDHANELSKHVAAIESDSGGFAPQGFRLRLKDKGRSARGVATLQKLVDLLAPIGANRAKAGFSGADISVMAPAGVPLLGLWVDGSKYFDYHHTPADTIDKVNPKELSDCVATMATAAYVLADMPGRLGDPVD